MTEYALVTGASRNIGQAIARRLKADGYSVIMLDVIEPQDPTIGEYVPVDLADQHATAQVLHDVVGDRPVSRLVNCAGMIVSGSLETIDPAQFDHVMGLNTRAYLQTMQAVVPGMKARGFGRIVNIASRSALGMANLGVYGASKGAVVTLTKGFAMELAPFGITCNAIGPGPIETDLMRELYPVGSNERAAYLPTIPVGRFGTPEDVAHVASFFLNDHSGFITGQILYSCGGLTVGLANS
ncbi:MAG: 3-oxoacyl-[acyl-carrier protein] reductase [Gammaproteobacteria bacterium]|jgi:3-oxoacyl-[acyl-carrier protein] reductase